MLDPHVHCAQCGRAIATTIAIAGGKTRELEIATAKQLALAKLPDGTPAAAERIVPICDECAGGMKAAAEARSSSILEVPSPRELLGL